MGSHPKAGLGKDLLPRSRGSRQHSVPQGCWKGGHRSLPAWARGCPQYLAAGPCQHGCMLPYSQQRSESATKSEVSIFCNLIMRVTDHHLCHVLLFRSKSRGPGHTQAEEIPGCEYQEVRNLDVTDHTCSLCFTPWSSRNWGLAARGRVMAGRDLRACSRVCVYAHVVLCGLLMAAAVPSLFKHL